MRRAAARDGERGSRGGLPRARAATAAARARPCSASGRAPGSPARARRGDRVAAGPSVADQLDGGAASDVRSTARAPRSATRQHTGAPVALLGRAAGAARTTSDARALGEVAPSSLAAGDDVLAVGDAALRAGRRGSPPTAASLARSGARARSTSRPISVATIRSRRRRRRRRADAVAQLADRLRRPPAARAPRCPPRRRSRRARPRATGRRRRARCSDASSTTTLASSARSVARATAGRPAPDSTASETSSNASRKDAGAAAVAPTSLAADIRWIVGRAQPVSLREPAVVAVARPASADQHRRRRAACARM